MTHKKRRLQIVAEMIKYHAVVTLRMDFSSRLHYDTVFKDTFRMQVGMRACYGAGGGQFCSEQDSQNYMFTSEDKRLIGNNLNRYLPVRDSDRQQRRLTTRAVPEIMKCNLLEFIKTSDIRIKPRR